MRSIRHWTSSYIVSRVRQALYVRRHPDLPWLNANANLALETLLKAGDLAFEWGAGRSTLWLAKRVGQLVSIEHNQEWYEQVKVGLAGVGRGNVQIWYRQNPEGYVRAIDECPDLFDFILVDGRWRDQCMQRAIKRVRPGGLLVLDDAHRYMPTNLSLPGARTMADGPATTTWAQVLKDLAGWRMFLTEDGVRSTAFWIAPAV